MEILMLILKILGCWILAYMASGIVHEGGHVVMGLGIWLCLAILTLAVAFVVEKKKKELNIQTFREILAFTEGQRLDEIEAIKEEAKRPYQKVLLAMAFAAIALILNLLLFFLLK